MLEKKLRNIDIRELHTILLLEADFNVANKIISNVKLIPTLECLRIILLEIIRGHREQLAI